MTRNRWKLVKKTDRAKPAAPQTLPSGPLASRRILLGVTGSIAAYKAVSLARRLLSGGAAVQVIMIRFSTL